ncbi:MAG: SAM-dependent chlorinase/fluorinase [Alphaproteobacteria bacterium]
MIVLFTDFGLEGPYVGQMKAVLQRDAPSIPVIDLFHDVPAHEVSSGAYLLRALAGEFDRSTVFLCVVDPGVGSEERLPVVVLADGQWFVGPGNGLFGPLAKEATAARCWEITWRPERLSATFHGRDLFAPVAARLAIGEPPPGQERNLAIAIIESWPAELAQIIYIDRFGNGVTGTRARTIDPSALLEVNGHRLERARIYSDVSPGQAFWYANANGLVEIAVNRGRADEKLGLKVGLEVAWRLP